jgi:hypothetical protein
MKTFERHRWLVVLAGLALVFVGTRNLRSSAGDLYGKKQAKGDLIAMPSPGEVKTLEVYPAKVHLKGIDDSQQLLITGVLHDRLQDLTGDVKYEVVNPAVAKISPSGRIIPLANGTTEVRASYGTHTISVTVHTDSCDVSLPINFPNQIVPIFTKLGCNSGGCHGKSGGQNGFALSLLGFVPEMDYQSLVKEDRGRRLLPASPEHSLLLLKAAGLMPHAGGKRMEVDSDEYKLIKRWIASGTPFGNPKDPVVTKITVYPETRVLTRNNRQQFLVTAHYSDGSTHDVTQRAQYESNDQEIAIVDGAALVRTLDMSGEAGVMARYQGNVSVFRATVPLGVKIPDYQFPYKTVVDKHTHAKWKELGIVPSELSTDEHFIRRVTLDLTGTLPTPTEVRTFLADPDPNKRDKLIDRLLETPEYAYFFANKWADVLRIKRRGQPGRAFGTFAFHDWIRQAIASDMPYSEFARQILAASGGEAESPPTVWYKEVGTPEQFVDDVAQVFLGLRMACAQCHHHPYEKWSQDDYWGLAAFYGRVGKKVTQQPGGLANQQNVLTTIYNKPTGNVINKRTQKPAELTPLDAGPITVSPEDDPRDKLVDWMVNPKNPYFARAVANRYWAHFFGRGIVDPIDDMRVTNPATNPALLDALAQELIDSGFSLKHLIKTIVKSRTYQLSAVPNQWNKHDKQSFARFYPRRMVAEVLYDAVNQVTNAPPTFGGMPQDKLAPKRAIMLPDEGFTSYFLEVFGKPNRLSACECERVGEANLAQALHLLNSDEIQNKLTRAGGRADLLAQDKRSDTEKVTELFLWALGRPPSPEHLQIALAHVEKHAKNKQIAYQNLIWVLINTKEFVFIQ